MKAEEILKILNRWSTLGENYEPKYIDPKEYNKLAKMLEEALIIDGVVVRLFDPENKPKISEDDNSFSEDVCIIDENGVHGIAYFSFESNKWGFHTDTLVDYYEVGAETKWKWYYPVVKVTDIDW